MVLRSLWQGGAAAWAQGQVSRRAPCPLRSVSHGPQPGLTFPSAERALTPLHIKLTKKKNQKKKNESEEFYC